MIERKFVAQKLKELQIQKYVVQQLGKIGHSKIEIKRTPLGEKIIIYSSRPGIIVGRKGENIRKLTTALKNKFKLENPQIEIGDVPNPLLDPSAVADRIAFTLERYGAKRFKFTGYDTLKQMLAAGAIGAEVVISGKVPSSRAKTWRFYGGYLKKSGDVAVSQVLKAKTIAVLKSGVIGIQVAIMPPDVKLPDKIIIYDKDVHAEVSEGAEEVEQKEEKKPKKKAAKKKERKKKAATKEEAPKEESQSKEAPKEVTEKKEPAVEKPSEQKEAPKEEVPTEEKKEAPAEEKQDGNNQEK